MTSMKVTVAVLDAVILQTDPSIGKEMLATAGRAWPAVAVTCCSPNTIPTHLILQWKRSALKFMGYFPAIFGLTSMAVACSSSG
jgi:hypothetical protein